MRTSERSWEGDGRLARSDVIQAFFLSLVSVWQRPGAVPATAAPWSSQLVSLAGTWISTGYRLLCQGSSPACKTCRGLGHEMEVRK